MEYKMNIEINGDDYRQIVKEIGKDYFGIIEEVGFGGSKVFRLNKDYFSMLIHHGLSADITDIVLKFNLEHKYINKDYIILNGDWSLGSFVDDNPFRIYRNLMNYEMHFEDKESISHMQQFLKKLIDRSLGGAYDLL